MVGKVRIKFKIEVIDNACLVVRAAHLMTHGEFAATALAAPDTS